MPQYATLNAAKANFNNIYDQPDPRVYPRFTNRCCPFC